MKWRVLKIAAIIAVLAFIGWFGSHLRFQETKIPLPLKGEAISNPFYVAIKLSEQLGADAAWERVFTEPPTDSVIILSTWNWNLSRVRRDRIEKWVESGGRLVVDESLIGGFDEFEKWTGVSELQQEEEEESEENADDAGDEDSAGGLHRGDEPVEEEDSGQDADEQTDNRKKERKRRRLNQRERALVEQFMDEECTSLREDTTERLLSVCGLDTTRSLASSRPVAWALRDGRKIHALRVKLGRGSVTVINAAPFRYRTFLEGNHPSLFVAATQLHRGDSLLFLTEEDHASLLALVWRFGAPVVLLLGALVALSLWRTSARFGPLTAPPERARRSLAEQIRGTGQFTLRFGGGRALHASLVRALREAAIRRLPSYDSMSSEDRIAAISRLTGVLASELGPAFNYSGWRSPHELRNVIAVLETARRRLSLQAKKNGN
jgi:hypothetical protein